MSEEFKILLTDALQVIAVHALSQTSNETNHYAVSNSLM